ncbi:hypothetical protein Tco_0374151 [Tanacetum coccineum]
MRLEKALLDFNSNQEKRLSHLRTQLGQQQDNMIGKINLLWKTVSEKHNDVSTPKNARNSMAPKSIVAISHDEREELRKKESKAPPKYVHFINSIVILSKDSDTEEDVSSTNARRRDLDRMTRGNKEVKEQGKEEDEIETNVEVKEVIEEEESEIETDEEVEEILKEEEEDEDDEYFNSFPTMNFAYECDFMILVDTTSIIDRCLGEMVFGRPFIDETGLVYNKEEGTVMFKQDNEKIKFKVPHTMEIFKQTRLMGASIDSIPPLAYEENFSNGRTHYYQSLLIGNEYRQDEGYMRGVRHLMRLEIMDNKGEVTLYLTRRSLEVIRKFHWTTLGGRSKQLSHVSSLLLSKRGKY